MTYAETRDSEQLRILDGAIAEFIARYKSRPPTARRQTLVFFPGAFGSALTRASTPYRDDAGPQQRITFQTIWLTEASLNPEEPDKNALNLRMHMGSHGVRRDHDDRIIIADGALEEGDGDDRVGLYDGFLDWCERAGFDWFVFGWDWRRRPDETATFFRTKFLPRFRSTVIDLCEGADPLANFSLVGHSFGGLIVSLVLRQLEGDLLADTMSRAVTVATPFYGFSGQVHFWFEPNYLFQLLGRRPVVEAGASMPASYMVNWLDVSTFKTHEAAFRADPKYPLADYPSVDAMDRAQVADPYDPQTNGALVRYPATTGFDMDELRHARELLRRLAEPLARNLAEKFFNIRGIQVTPEGVVTNKTPSDTTWRWIEPTFDPDIDETPIADGPLGPGDRTLPAWSTHLVTLAAANRRTVEIKGEHMFIMNETMVQDELADLLGADRAAIKMVEPRSRPLPEPATSEEALTYLRGLHRLRRPGLVAVDPSDVARYRNQFSHEKLRSIYRRIMMDLMK